MQFKNVVECDLCHELINMPSGLVIYDKAGNAIVCHKECGFKLLDENPLLSDFEIGGPIHSTEKDVYDHLHELAKAKRVSADVCMDIIAKITE